jgi:uncharacterized phage protein (TIGR01671 family)
MREIKFRAWIIADKDMLYNATSIYDCVYGDTFADLINNDKVELMQYTGLTDKNGKEIYEGDIVKYHDFYAGDYKERGGTAQIIWDEEEGHSVCKVDKEDGELFYICSTWDMCKNYGGEVIGNIYENSNLLKDGE